MQGKIKKLNIRKLKLSLGTEIALKLDGLQ